MFTGNSKKNITMALILVLLFFNVCPLRAKASDTSQEKVVRVACGMNAALYLDDNGDPAGMGLMYIRQLAWSAGWTVEYVEGTYSESLQRLYDGEIDLMFPIGINEDPDGKLLFSEFNGGVQQIGLFAKEDADIYYEDFQAFEGKKVGLSIGGNSAILDTYAQEHGFSYEKVADYGDVQGKIDALMNGDVDMVAFSTLNEVPGGKLVAVLDQLPVYVCTSKENTQLYQELNNAISDTMIKTPDVVSKYYQDMLAGTTYISYTREEHEKIENTDTIKFGVYSDFLPLSGVNSDGECIGIYVDAIKALAKKSGLKIEIIPVEDDSKLYQYMDDGTVDFVMSLYDLRFHTDNADNYLISNGIADYTTVAVSLPGNQFDENGNTSFVLTKQRDYLEGYIYANFPNATISYLDTRKDCMKAVAEGRADATFMNTWEYNYESMNPRFQNLMEWENIRIDSTFAIGARKDSDMELLDIFEKTVAQFQDSTVSDIINKNLNMKYMSYTLDDRIYMLRNPILFGVILVVTILAILIVYLRVKKKYINDLIIANRAKSDFLSRMSHELRTPLNAISGYASLEKSALQNKDTDIQKQIRNMDSIGMASDYLLGIVKDILDIQQMETGEIEITRNEINPNEYMGTVVDMVKLMAKEKNVDFSYQMINGKDDNYLLDALRLQEVLLNLLYNAVKFTPSGGRVEMTSEILEKDEKYATMKFVVKDTGVGMSKEFLDNKLFQLFSQENQKITSPYSGVGNSMAITKKLVDLMGGSIECISEPEKGTTFTVTIKAEHCNQTKKRRKRKEMPKYDLHGVRVLMCEDNEMNQDMERRLLERMNCEVDVAADGQIGLDKFRESKEFSYDVILMDIRMPNMDGLECTREIRSLERKDAKTIPILAVSANAFESDVANSIQAGMNEHLSKPIDAKILYNKISFYCEKKEQKSSIS